MNINPGRDIEGRSGIWRLGGRDSKVSLKSFSCFFGKKLAKAAAHDELIS